MTESTTPTPEVALEIDYTRFAGTVSNLDFKGRGRLVIRAGESAYVFSGRPRRLFAGGTEEMIFTAADITNVVVQGTLVQFKTHLGKSGRSQRPFVFYCASEAAARAVASLLPAHQEAEFTETHGFIAQLNSLAEAGSPWTSVTNIIIALNAAVFVLMGALGAGWIQTESMLPYILYGANNGAATTDGEWWRLLTSMFMHYGIMHLLLNMWALYQAGHFLEKLQGRRLYTLTYLGSGLAGGLASIFWNGDKTWSAGASGAVFGVFGAIVGYMLREKQALPPSVYRSMMKSSLTFAGYNILYGMARSGIDNSAHLGGVAGGLVLGWLLALPLNREARAQFGGQRLALGVAAVGVMLAAGVWLTPRFDYRVSDVLAWEEANRVFAPQETELLKQHDLSLQRVARGEPDPAYPDWLETNLIPFYERWAHALAVLTPEAGKSTARARAAMLEIFQLKIASYHHLAAGLRAQDATALRQFNEEDSRVSLEIAKLQRLQPR